MRFFGITISFFLLLFVGIKSETKLFIPQYAEVNQPFQAISSFSIDSDSISTILFVVNSDKNYQISDAEFKWNGNSKKIDNIQSISTNYGYSYLITIQNQKFQITKGEVVQIVLNVKSAIEGTQKFLLSRINNKSEANKVIDFNADNFIEINIYSPQKRPGNAIRIAENSQLLFSLSQIKKDIFEVNFWMRFSNTKIPFLTFYNKNSNKTEFTLTFSEYNSIIIDGDVNNLVVSPYFLSVKCWYYCRLSFNKNEKTLEIYVNDWLINKIHFNSGIENYSLQFNGKKDPFRIDELSISTNELKNNLPNQNNNEQKILSYFSFDNLLNEYESNGIKIETKNLQLIKSTVPLFYVSPDLTVTQSGSSLILEWEINLKSEAVNFSVEKSLKGDNFNQIALIERILDKKTYSFIDKSTDTKILYYRIKQTNNDGSVVYSPIVKIGQGDIQSVELKQNYPNPFNPNTVLKFELFIDSFTEISVYSLEGKLIETIFRGELANGIHEFPFDGSNLPSGIYLWSVTANNTIQSRKMILAK